MKPIQHWTHFHSHCSLSWIVLPLLSHTTCISKLGNSHQSVWQNFPVVLFGGLGFVFPLLSQKVCIFQMPVTHHSRISQEQQLGLRDSQSKAWVPKGKKKRRKQQPPPPKKKKAIWNRRFKPDYLHSINQNKTINQCISHPGYNYFLGADELLLDILSLALVGNSVSTTQNVCVIWDCK